MAELTIQCPSAPSDTGAYRLEWSGAEGSAVRLRETGPDGTMEVIYEGIDSATAVSGRTEGLHQYSVSLVSDRWEVAGGESPSCTVSVDPPPMSLAFGLFGAGLVVCVATVVAILLGHRAHRRGAIG